VDPFYTATNRRSRGALWSIYAPALSIWFSGDWTPHFQPCSAGDSAHRGGPICALMQRAFGPIFLRLEQPCDALYCGGMSRYLAAFIDWIVVLSINGISAWLGSAMGAQAAGAVVGLLIALVYLTILDRPEMGGTLGKRLNRLRVLTRDGGSPRTGQLAGRALIKLALLSILPLVFLSIALDQGAVVTFGWLGLFFAFHLYLIAVWGWSTRRRMLQDYLTGTCVVEPEVQSLLRASAPR